MPEYYISICILLSNLENVSIKWYYKEFSRSILTILSMIMSAYSLLLYIFTLLIHSNISPAIGPK